MGNQVHVHTPSNNVVCLDGEHQWEPLTAEERAVESDKIKDADCDYAVLVVGTTGMGKSSLIKTITANDSIVACGGVQSVTQQNGFYLKNNVLWIDTKGSLDKDQSSDHTLKDIKSECFQHGICKIKVIWCVDDGTRSTRELQTQAQSISSYSASGEFVEEKCNVWDSCLIIEKGSGSNCTNTACSAAVQAVGNVTGSNSSTRGCQTLGFKCIDWYRNTLAQHEDGTNTLNDGEAQKLRTEIELYDVLGTNAQKFGYMTEKQVIDAVEAKLKLLPILEFRYDLQKCKACTLVGDPTFVKKSCHTRQKRYHVHRQGGLGSTRHSSRTGKRHPGKMDYKWSDTVYDDINNMPAPMKVFFLHPGIHAVRLFQKKKQIWYYECCGNGHNSEGCQTFCKACDEEILSDNGCIRLCSQCNQDVNSEGCLLYCEKCNGKWGESLCN